MQKNKNNKSEDRLPFAIFVCIKNDNEKEVDYKEVFTQIISDRIKKQFE